MTGSLTYRLDRYIKLIGVYSRRYKFGRKLERGLIILAVIAGLATFVTIAGWSPLVKHETISLGLLYFDFVFLLLLAVPVGLRVYRIWNARRGRTAGSRLHTRLAIFFGLLAITPAIFVAAFAAIFLNFGIESWFSEPVRAAVNESEVVAHAYLQEHQQNIRADVLAMANDLNNAAPRIRSDPKFFAEFVATQAAIRDLPEAVIVDGNGRTLARSGLSFSLEFELHSRQMLQRVLNQIQSDRVIILPSPDDRIRAGIKLDAFVDAYLFVGRLVAPEVLEHVASTQRAAERYKELEKSQKELQISFIAVFVMVALLLLFAAIWLGLTFANQLADPIGGLIAAAERVSKGDLTARVKAPPSADELGVLARTFNRMTGQLETQRDGLVAANAQLDERRQFTEAVLSGVSAGVIGLDKDGRIRIANRSASQLLEADLKFQNSERLETVVPELAPLLKEARRRPARMAHAEISLTRGEQVRTIVANIAAERVSGATVGFVLTFDDVSELMAAQRKAAWADIARRIAHEIKNPLTPIQLSAERLQRKYLDEIRTDKDTFSICTETIVRQVQDIRRMVDEFSQFARMPQPVFAMENLAELCRQALFLERNRHSDIDYVADLPSGPVPIYCDRDQVNRILTNVLKNAAESILARDARGGEKLPKGRIEMRIEADGTATTVTLDDNGVGLPAEIASRLTEPYVTTREKGTGLGLAIAKRIMDDHQGELIIKNGESGGASVSLVFHHIDEDWTDAPAGGTPTETEAVKAKTVAHGT
jgi:two-component system nitrogen regulation sensor histidine kinase NtrY